MPRMPTTSIESVSDHELTRQVTQKHAADHSGRGGARERAPMDTESELASAHRELLERLMGIELDKEGTELPFSSRLARDNMWTREFALRVCDEYRRFLFLAATSPRMVTPSEAVDEAWHLHLLYTKSYWNDLCANTLGHPLHHIPTEGGDEQHGHYAECYSYTLSAYAQVFGELPPAEIWPPVEMRFRQAGRKRTVNLDDHWVVRKPGKLAFLAPGLLLIALGWWDMGASLHGLVPATMFFTGLGVTAWSVITAADVLTFAAGSSVDGGGGCGGCGGCGG